MVGNINKEMKEKNPKVTLETKEKNPLVASHLTLEGRLFSGILRPEKKADKY